MPGGLSGSNAPTGAIIGAIGFAAPAAAVIHSGRASECWTATAADVDAWLRTARPGEAFVYAHGPQLVQGGAAARITQLTQEGAVTPHHKRASDGGFDFLVRCNRVKVMRAAVCTADMLQVLYVLQQAAQAGQRCPSDADIGDMTGLTADQVKWQLKKLAAARFITRQTVPAPGDPKFRVVTVIATGASTAGPSGAGR